MFKNFINLLKQPSFWSPLMILLGTFIGQLSTKYAVCATIVTAGISQWIGKVLKEITKNAKETETPIDDIIHAIGEALDQGPNKDSKNGL